MKKYQELTRKIKTILIILVLLAIIYPIIITILINFDFTGIANFLLSISSYLGAIIGSILGILGAIYVIFLSLAHEEENKYKNELPKKLRVLDKIKDLENEFMLFSYNEGINLEDNQIGKALYIYKERFKYFYGNLMDLALEVDINYYNQCSSLFKENNYVIKLIDNANGSENNVDKLKISTSILSNLNLFKSEQTEKVMEISKIRTEELGTTKTIEERGYYDIYEIAFILNANTNHQLRELANITNNHRRLDKRK